MRPLTLQPGYVEADVTALLAGGHFVYAELFTITPKVGPELLYCNTQKDISVVPVDGVERVIYRSKQVFIKGLKLNMGIGLEVDEQDIELAYDDELRYQGHLTFSEALRQGRLDGATIKRARVVGPEFGIWYAVMPMFTGLISSLDKVGRQTANVKVKSDLVLLNVQMPRDLWQVSCKHTWGDAGCGIDQSDFAEVGAAASGSTRTVLNWAGVTEDFVMGKVHIHNNDDVTRIRTILKVNPGVSLTMIYPLDFDPGTGLTFTAYPNCRRMFERCGDYHADPENHYLGFKFIPVAETAA